HLLVKRIIGAAAQRGQRLVAGDREYPGGNLRAPFEAPSVFPHVEKRVAREILGGGRVVHDPEHETVDSQMMARVEDLHCGSVAGGDAFYEPFIGTVVLPVGMMGGNL